MRHSPTLAQLPSKGPEGRQPIADLRSLGFEPWQRDAALADLRALGFAHVILRALVIGP